MAEENKIIRLADVGELEADLKKDLAEEEAKDQNCGGCAFNKSKGCALRNPPPEWEIEAGEGKEDG